MTEAAQELQPIEERPLVTFALFAYNQEKYIREAVEGAFAQTYEPLEIILSDDCSSDRTYEIMKEMVSEYQGPHKLVIRKPIKNLGLASGISEVCEMASGKLIVAAAGDDISHAQRTKEVVKAWKKNGMNSGSLYSHFRTISPDGVVSPPKSRWGARFITLKDRKLDILNGFSGVSGCAHAWTKDIFEIFGPIDEKINHEDVIIPLRALLIGSITFIPLDLVDYRITPGSITRKTYNSAAERIKKMREYWGGRVAIFDQFKKDLQHVSTSATIQQEDIAWISEKVSEGERYATLVHHLYSIRTAERLRLLFRPSLNLPLRQRMKWVVISIAPWAYAIKK